MALITEAPATITGKLTSIFSSVPPLSGSTRGNLVVEFEQAAVRAVYTNEPVQLSLLSTQKEYCVFMGPLVKNGTTFVLKVAYMGATYTCELAIADAQVEQQLTFTKDE